MKAAATLARLAASGSSGVPTRLCSARLSLLEPPTTCTAGCGWVAAIFSASRLPPEVTISSSAAERLSELLRARVRVRCQGSGSGSGLGFGLGLEVAVYPRDAVRRQGPMEALLAVARLPWGRGRGRGGVRG